MNRHSGINLKLRRNSGKSANVPTSRYHGNSLIANVIGIFSRAIGLNGFHIAADNRIRQALRRCASEVARKRTGHFRKSAEAEKTGRKRSDTPPQMTLRKLSASEKR